jgi:hypothetical protein
MPEQLTSSTRIARSEGLVAEPMEGGVVVLDPKTDRYLRLNATGRLIWESLAEPATVAELARALGEQTGVDADRAEADATSFIEGLIELGAARPV